jgi:hypothetical protein
MQNDPTTDNQTQPPLIDREDWEIAFEPYEGQPNAAIRLGFNVAILRTHFEGQLIKSRPVMEALDLAMEVLFPFTSFHQASFDLFLRLTEGKLTFEEEQMLKALGVKF